MDSSNSSFVAGRTSMLDGGVYLPPSQFETAFVSAAHTEEDIEFALDTARKALGSL